MAMASGKQDLGTPFWMSRNCLRNIMKTRVEDLALFDGTSSFHEKLHVGRPNIGDRAHLLDRINDMLDRNWLSNGGPFVQEFEQRIAELSGTKHCIAMCNATIALEIAIRALGLTGEVLVPSFTFIATAHALQWQEITPVFCDIDPVTHAIDPRAVERMITPRTTGVIGVHVWGHPCPVESLAEIATRHNLRLMFDGAHALGCSHRGQLIGSFGDATIFSFHATKFCNAFEGGAVVTNNDDLAAKIRLMKNFGFAGYDNVIYIGTNGKMTEVSAAMGLTSLDSLGGFIATNRANYEHYLQELSSVPGLRLLTYDTTEERNYQYVVLEINEAEIKVSRDVVMQALWAENVLVRRYFYPGCHRMEPYRSYFPNAGLLLPVTEEIAARVLVLPTGSAVGAEEVQTICDLIKLVVANGRLVQAKVNATALNTVNI